MGLISKSSLNFVKTWQQAAEDCSEWRVMKEALTREWNESRRQ